MSIIRYMYSNIGLVLKDNFDNQIFIKILFPPKTSFLLNQICDRKLMPFRKKTHEIRLINSKYVKCLQLSHLCE